jgi:bacillithiol system protein YtxJ
LALKDRIEFLTTPEQVDAFLAKNPSSAIFKAGTCHKTNEGFAHVEDRLGPREDLPVGIVRVVEARSASNRVAEITGLRHESPQLILFKDGKAVFDRDNWDITAEDLDAALAEHFVAARQ